ncbi:hypothetical protein RHMOL_Rhmol01G0249100 [Rhododendron molle]|uniref:Uncharacterized protein n=1 Tax=Rhododendron molle TaxID=49168 RepID=A0ACC0Q7U5_RHOML|nr:hypothetical protein RHMOL_Rhmol01G0249100 [Rhododendron molle]
MAINPNPKPPHLFSLLLLFSLHILSLSASDAPTVYELLPKYGLPSGLLPDSVKSYSLSSDDGTFVVELDKPCYIQFDYLVYYDKKITGKLKYGSITDLKGIQVQRLFIWFDVDEIKVDLPPSDSIYFLVGFINKKLDVDQFKTVRSCGAKKSKASVPCGRLWKRVIELPTPVDEVEMLITD